MNKQILEWSYLCETDEQRSSREERELLCEMANKFKTETLLPMNIWIDETESYKRGGHSKRIKFQLDKGNRYTNNLGSMDLDGNLQPPTLEIGELRDSDIRSLRNFVLNNRYALSHVADQDIHLFEIWSDIIKGGTIASEEEVKSLNAKVDILIAKKKDKTDEP